MFEVEEDHLHEDQGEDAAHEQHGKLNDRDGERRQHDRGQDRRAVHLPGLVAGLETLEHSQPHRTPSDHPSGGGADDRPQDGDQVRVHGCRVSRIASSGALRPVHIRKESEPWASRTSQPSTARSPSERALRTRGVPPVT